MALSGEEFGEFWPNMFVMFWALVAHSCSREQNTQHIALDVSCNKAPTPHADIVELVMLIKLIICRQSVKSE